MNKLKKRRNKLPSNYQVISVLEQKSFIIRFNLQDFSLGENSNTITHKSSFIREYVRDYKEPPTKSLYIPQTSCSGWSHLWTDCTSQLEYRICCEDYADTSSPVFFHQVMANTSTLNVTNFKALIRKDIQKSKKFRTMGIPTEATCAWTISRATTNIIDQSRNTRIKNYKPTDFSIKKKILPEVFISSFLVTADLWIQYSKSKDVMKKLPATGDSFLITHHRDFHCNENKIM